MDAPLSITRREAPVPGVTVLEVAGDLVLTSRPALRSAVEREVADGADRVVVDLARATHVDMTGFALLVRLEEECREAGTALVVAALPAAFREVSEALCLPRVLRMTDGVEAALDPPS